MLYFYCVESQASNISKYRLKSIENKDRIPLFFDPAVLDIIAPNQWNVFLSDEYPDYAWVYTEKKTFGFHQMIISDPLGYNGLLSFSGQFNQKEVVSFLKNLKNSFKSSGRLYARLDYSFNIGDIKEVFKSVNKPVFVIEPSKHSTELYKNSLSRQLKKFNKSENSIVEENASKNASILSHKAYQSRGMQPPYDQQICENFMDKLISAKKGKVISAYDKNNNLLASIAIAIDHQRHYYLFGGVDREIVGNTGHPAVLHHAISDAVNNGKTFDFQGSSIPGIAKYFSKFGAEKKHYKMIDEYPNKLFKRIKSFRNRF